MARKAKAAEESTTLRFRRKTAVVLTTIAKAKEKTVEDLVWEMLQEKYSDEIKLVMQLSGKLDDEDTPAE